MQFLPALFSRCLLSLLLSLPLLAAETDPAAPVELVVGGRRIIVPPPAGFVRCDGVDPEWDRAVESVQAPANKLLANFGTPEDHAAIRNGEVADYTRSFNVQVSRALESVEVNERTFDKIRQNNRKEVENLKASIEAEIEKVVRDGGKQMSDELGVDLQLSVGDLAMLGIFEDTPTSLGFTMAMTMSVQTPEGLDKSRNVVAAMLVPVNGRMLFLYSNSGYSVEADRLSAESSVKSWRDAVVAANPRVKGSLLGSLTKGAGKSAAIGAIAGGLVAVLVVLYRRFKR